MGPSLFPKWTGAISVHKALCMNSSCTCSLSLGHGSSTSQFHPRLLFSSPSPHTEFFQLGLLSSCLISSSPPLNVYSSSNHVVKNIDFTFAFSLTVQTSFTFNRGKFWSRIALSGPDWDACLPSLLFTYQPLSVWMSSGVLILLKRMLVQFAYHFLILEKGHNPLYSQGFPVLFQCSHSQKHQHNLTTNTIVRDLVCKVNCSLIPDKTEGCRGNTVVL